ncbi:extracellular solute-binding protein (plasmid) [Aminobacter sp. SR38]|jgi:putative spermidine/putrescine transport system substrate-binding protein|uniref:extracellular solute-binding protein n=1 Tax=Aminobacter sp. SR38 TaxID=2774562 RepID=UPI00177C52C2|nr:extracellular solute-binding protein [Aminobacter sp. SR38]QOF75073.1 extracellular solute-binding protein [Aminobacter sp. SR38]
MTENTFFKQMLIDSAHAYKAGRMDRRSFLLLCGMAGVATSAVRIGDAEAATNQIVLWNWGGDAERCHSEAIGQPFTEKTGIPLRIDTSGPLQGKIREMVDSGNVTADVADADAFDALALGKAGYLEPIDYSIVDKSKVVDGYTWEHGVSVVFYGYAFMYNTKVFGDNPPANWADFFDTVKYPGKRSLYKWANGTLEGALLADGVAKSALYPLDVDRALAKIKSIKDDSLYWGAASEAHSMIVNDEVVMGMVFQNRGRAIEEDTEGRFKLVMNEAVAMPGAYIVPRGNPGGADAMRFIAQALELRSQLSLLECHGMTPSNPAAFAQIPEALIPYTITSSANIDKVVFNDPGWWAENGSDAVNAYLDAIS